MWDEGLLSRVEDASLNASAPPQQRWLDGWLLRLSPGKAKRARCINAVAAGRIPLAQKLTFAERAFRAASLPMVVRITRFTQPEKLDADLAALGYSTLDDTRVLLRGDLAEFEGVLANAPLPADLHWAALPPADYAEVVGELRGSPREQRDAHAERLRLSPVPYQGFAIRVDGSNRVLACGQIATEDELVGLYDVFTRDDARGQGLATQLCQRLLSTAARQGAKVAYLQVEHDNLGARRIYEQRLGFTEGYRYHYRQHPAA